MQLLVENSKNAVRDSTAGRPQFLAVYHVSNRPSLSVSNSVLLPPSSERPKQPFPSNKCSHYAASVLAIPVLLQQQRRRWTDLTFGS